MNETRQQIIKLIAPHMNKTYYDITAILTYIDFYAGNQFCKFLIEGKKIIVIRQATGELYKNLKIPNKPLLLYSHEEEKDLLKLLINIK